MANNTDSKEDLKQSFVTPMINYPSILISIHLQKVFHKSSLPTSPPLPQGAFKLSPKGLGSTDYTRNVKYKPGSYHLSEGAVRRGGGLVSEWV